jgi:hypothetical protein
MKRILSAIAAVALAVCGLVAPASATINPVISIGFVGSGVPGQGRLVSGTIVFGASDTYVAGGFTVTPANLGCAVAVTSINYNSPAPAWDVVASFATGIVTLKFATTMGGASNMTSAATTKTVTVPTGLTANDVLVANTPIYVTLDDAATAGGGSGTWAVTNAVSTVKFVSGSTFTLTTIAAAPASNGNFVWNIPTLNMEMAAATPIASFVMPFTATCL